jgi:hypothetical protein
VKLAPYDWGISRHRTEDPPEAGDYLLAEGATGYGRAYRILNARLMARSEVKGRYSLTCQVVGTESAIPEGARRLIIRWYPRNQRRRRTR